MELKINTPDGLFVIQNQSGPARIESTMPDAYRLARRTNGEMVLQGSFRWQEGWTYGHEWRDIPTVDLDVPNASLSGASRKR